jgi:hypothetical protein
MITIENERILFNIIDNVLHYIPVTAALFPASQGAA